MAKVIKPQSEEKQERVMYVYKEFEDMRDVMQQQYPEFNDRTLRQFVDDSQKRANSYVLSRDNQDKEDWQANVFTQYTRNKIKAQIASVARRPPDITIRATNDKDEVSIKRGEVMKSLVLASYLCEDGNPEEEIFFDGWDCCIVGTIIKYDGYLKTRAKVKQITSYDPQTGEIETEESEVDVEDRPIELPVAVEDFYIKDPYIRDVQKQPEIIWTRYFDKGDFDYEFSNFKDHDKVKVGSQLRGNKNENALYMADQWFDRIAEDKVEVVYFYNKRKDEYMIIANGILLLDAPLLWGKKKKKYPFAKSVYEPFSYSNFFWGNSLPNILMGNQDVANAFINSMVDKTYRSLETPMLVGQVNRDAFELEDEYVTGDTKIYVDDINQVKPMPIVGVTQGEMSMLEIISRGIDQASTDTLQSGQGSSGSTAREIVLANERAEELKGLFFLMLKSLWLQKVRLRTLNILMNYSKPVKVESIVGADGAEVFYNQYRTYTLPNSDLTGGKGTLQIGIGEEDEIKELNRPIGITEEGKEYNKLDVKEEYYKLQGKPLEIMMITSDYLDDYDYYITVETESFYQSNKALDKAMEIEKITTVSQAFPEIFMANKDKFFKDLIKHYGDSPDEYQIQSQQMMNPMAQMMGGEQGMPEVAQEVAAPTQTLPKLTGAEV